MPIIAKSSGSGDFDIPDEGVYLARCYKIVDVGTQTTTGVYGTKEARKVYFWWELLGDADGEPVKQVDGKPFSIMANYTLSLHPKSTLRPLLDSWRGKKFTEDEAQAFDIEKLADKFCLLQVSHNPDKNGSGRVYANVDNIMSTKRTVKGVNPVSIFTVSEPDSDEFERLPQFIKDKIEASPEYQGGGGSIDPQDFPADDVDQEQPKPTAPAEKTVAKSELPF